MIYLEKSFGFLSLRTGGLIIGWLTTIGHILGIFGSIVVLSMINIGSIYACDQEIKEEREDCTAGNCFLNMK